jgi:hypothetical protein
MCSFFFGISPRQREGNDQIRHLFAKSNPSQRFSLSICNVSHPTELRSIHPPLLVLSNISLSFLSKRSIPDQWTQSSKSNMSTSYCTDLAQIMTITLSDAPLGVKNLPTRNGASLALIHLP